MPTGYTECVESGKVTDLRTFALQCARAFGACIMQRDNDFSEPPKHREVSDYHAKALVDAQAKLAALHAMTPGEVETATEADYQKRMQDWRSYLVKDTAENERYDAMLKKVQAWKPPMAEHEGLKKFMIEQIQMSRNDMSSSFYEEPKRFMPGDWLANAISSAEWGVEYHAKNVAEEIERCRSANAWIDALYASLPVEGG